MQQPRYAPFYKLRRFQRIVISDDVKYDWYDARSLCTLIAALSGFGSLSFLLAASGVGLAYYYALRV